MFLEQSKYFSPETTIQKNKPTEIIKQNTSDGVEFSSDPLSHRPTKAPGISFSYKTNLSVCETDELNGDSWRCQTDLLQEQELGIQLC